MPIVIHEPTIVMIVEDTSDDEALVLRAIRGLSRPLDVWVARDGYQALEMLGIEPGDKGKRVPELLPKFILLDFKLPFMNGPEVLARIRGCAQTTHIPVVFFTSSDEVADVTLAKAAGANSYVRKPVDYDEYVKTVRDVVTYWVDCDQTPMPPFCKFDDVPLARHARPAGV